TGIGASLAPSIQNAAPVGHQAADLSELAVRECRGNTMAHRQIDQLYAPATEKRIAADEKRIMPLAHDCRESRIDLWASAGIENMDLHPDRAGSRFRLSRRGIGSRRIGRIDEQDDAGRSGYQRTQMLQSLAN